MTESGSVLGPSRTFGIGELAEDEAKVGERVEHEIPAKADEGTQDVDHAVEDARVSRLIVFSGSCQESPQN